MLPDRMFTTFRTAAQGMAVQREKIAVASRNIAIAGTTAPPDSNQEIRPQSVRTSLGDRDNFQQMLLDNVAAQRGGNRNAESGTHNLGPRMQVVETPSFRFEYDPNHPDADENGMVQYPDIDLIREMTTIVSANRLFEANVSVVEAEKQIIRRSLEI